MVSYNQKVHMKFKKKIKLVYAFLFLTQSKIVYTFIHSKAFFHLIYHILKNKNIVVSNHLSHKYYNNKRRNGNLEPNIAVSQTV